MFKKILIANRGEIACRVIKTARVMGIATVAVYSDADRRAMHVRMADEAFYIGESAAVESYLKSEVIIDAAKQAGAEAIHPGYGFLSENAEFAEDCTAAGIIFIGPSADAMRAMGLKDKAKDIMEKAGVPVVPGYRGKKQDTKSLQSEADKIGYPVLIKAVAGGGGKGMRLVETAKEFPEALESCKRESKASFANDHVLIEKYITKPRHIEVQVFGDTHGNAVYLFERDCSLQRRHQKVVEEAPAPGLSKDVRESLGDAAVTAVKALKYCNAGTIEFIMDSETQNFFFMEMNTRLQVEHPVTEMITGQDLVEWQLRVANGEKLPCLQKDLSINGHGFEVRLYAEDPANEFLPQTGKITHFSMPSPLYPPSHKWEGGDVAKRREGGGPLIRLDAGVEQGDSVSIHYDPMIAKLIVWGKDRATALDKMRQALAGLEIAGLTTNQEFLTHVFSHPDFADGNIDTGFITCHEDALIPDTYGKAERAELALAAIYLLMGFDERSRDRTNPWNSHDNWRMGGYLVKRVTLMNKGATYEITATCCGHEFELEVESDVCYITQVFLENGTLSLVLDGKEIRGTVVKYGNDLTIFRQGRVVALHLFIHGVDDEDAVGEGRILTPMPGKIIKVLVKQGDEVDKNQPLLIMEAMKMEMTIRAGCAGVVDELAVATGDQVADGALLVSIEQKEAA